MMIIILDKVSAEAKEYSRLMMNFNFYQSLGEKCQRFLNAVEYGTVVEIHRHPTKYEVRNGGTGTCFTNNRSQ